MKLKPLWAALPALLLAAASPSQAVVSTTSPSNWILSPGADLGGGAGAFDGVAKLLFTAASDGGSYVCSGSLLAGGRYVLTAAHCADDFTTMTADFKFGTVTANVTQAYVKPGWAGFSNSVGNGSDIAILKLDQKITGIQGFNLSTTNDVGSDMLIAGYGLVGTGTTGATDFDRPSADLWRPHYGYNTADTTDKLLNDTVFGAGSGSNQFGETYVFDFDNGRLLKNALQRIANNFGGSWTSSRGLGENEALIAGGDSGGGDFVWNGSEWLVSGVHSYGWGLCGGLDIPLCDRVPGTNSSFGDLSGSTAVFNHADWINSVTGVPEPETYALMLAGLVAVTGAVRRRRARQG
jgi:secreted trypsin-like serine protease